MSDYFLHYRKGKLKPLDIVDKNATGRYLHLFTCMCEVNGDVNIEVASEYVCHMYYQPKVRSVDDARYNEFMQMTGKIDRECWRRKPAQKIYCSLGPK